MTAAAAFACGMAATVILGAAIWLITKQRILSSRLRERVIVTTKTGEAFTGILFSHDAKSLVLRQTEALGMGERQTNLPLDGELVVLLPDVAYIQKP